MSLADGILDGLGPSFAELAGDLLEPMVTALTADADDTVDMLEPTPDEWPALFDLAATTAPAWLGQLAGVQVDPTLDPDRQRALITDRPEWATGTYQGLLTTLKSCLTGRRRVVVDERDTSPWHATITVHQSDYPAGTTDATITALAERHRPAGMTFAYIYLTATSYGSAELDALTYAEAEATAGTYGSAES